MLKNYQICLNKNSVRSKLDLYDQNQLIFLQITLKCQQNNYNFRIFYIVIINHASFDMILIYVYFPSLKIDTEYSNLIIQYIKIHSIIPI